MDLRIPALVVAALAVSACRPAQVSPAPRTVEPAQVTTGTSVELVIRGRDFLPQVQANFATPSRSLADESFRITLGDHVLSAVQWVSATELHARLPHAPAPGLYALSVTAPDGAKGTLEAAVRVVGLPAQALRFDSEPQQVAAGTCSGAVEVVAVDAKGAPGAPVDGDQVVWTVAPSEAASLFADASCTVAVSASAFDPSSRARVFFRGLRPGAFTLDATSQTGSASQQELLVVGPAARVVWDPVDSPQTREVAFPVRAELQDAAGNRVAYDGPGQLGAGTVPARCAEGCDGLGDPLFSGGVFLGRIVVDASAAAVVLTLTVGSASGDSAAVDVLAPPPTQLAFVTGPRTVIAGGCSAVITVALRDASGAEVPARTATALTLGGPEHVTFHADAACTVPLAAPAIPPGGSSLDLFVAGTVAGAAELTASATGLLPAAQPLTVTPGTPASLVWDPIQGPKTPGDAFAVRVQVRDGFGNAAPADGAATLSTVGGAPFTCVDGCDGGGRALFTAGEFQGLVSVDTVASGERLRAVLGTASGTSDAFDVQAAGTDPPVALAFASAPQQVLAGRCSPPVVVELRSASGLTVDAPSAIDVTSTVTPAGIVERFADAACATPLTTLRFDAGVSQRTFHVRGVDAGGGTLKVEAATLTAASQAVVILPAETAGFEWDPLPATVRHGADVDVALRAVDAFGNRVEAFASTADLTISPAAGMLCARGCDAAAAPARTAAFVAGRWKGTVRVGPPLGSGRVLTATAGSVTGASAAFEVVEVTGTPPVAVLGASPVLVRAGEPVLLDANGSTDAESALSTLQVRWDPDENGGWSGWSGTPTTSHVYTTPGLRRPRLAVRDPDGNVAYATADVLVLDAATALCVVTVGSAADDGAAGCGDPDLSLPEAIRISNATPGRQVITFAPALAVAFSTFVTVSDTVSIIGQPGVTLTGVQWHFNAGDVLLSSLTLLAGGNNRPLGDLSGGALTVSRVTARGWAGLAHAGGDLRIEGSRFENCAAACIAANPGARHLWVRNAFFSGAGQNAFNVHDCDVGDVREVIASEFRTLTKGIHVKNGCGEGAVLAIHNTFDGVESPLMVDDGAGHVVVNDIFTNVGSDALSGCGQSFAARSHHVLWNADPDGCTDRDPEVLVADPAYVAPGTLDHRLRLTSPARDSGLDLGYWLVPGADTPFLGMAPDRGGRETW